MISTMGVNRYIMVYFLLLCHNSYCQEHSLNILKKSGVYRGIESLFGIMDEFDFNNDSIADIRYSYRQSKNNINYYITEIYSIINDSTVSLLYKYDNLFSPTCSDRSNVTLCDSINNQYVYPDYCRAKFDNNKITMMFYIEAAVFIEIDFVFTPTGYFSTKQREYLDNPITKEITLDYEISIPTDEGIYLQEFSFPTDF